MKQAFVQPFKNTLTCQYLVLILLLLGLSIPVLISWLGTLLTRDWSDNLLQVGSALILLCGLLKALKQPKNKTVIRPCWIGLMGLTAVAVVHFMADFYWVKSVYWASFIGLLAGFCWAIAGGKTLLRWFPFFLFSAFMLPIVNAEIQMAVSLPLQMASTWLTAQISGLFIPVIYQHNLLYIRDDIFEITGDCSGLQSWLGFLFAGLIRQMFDGTDTRELVMLLPFSLILALLLNGLRLMITALVAYHVSADQAVSIHTNLDFVLLPIGFFFIWEAGGWFRKRKASISNETINREPERSCPKTCVLGLTALLLLLLGVGHYLFQIPLQVVDRPIMLSKKIDNWSGVDEPLSQEEMRILAGRAIINRRYQQEGGRYLWVTLLESSSIQYIHNFLGCLISQGVQPEMSGKMLIRSERGVIGVPVMTYRYHGNRFYELLWYQWDGGSAQNRWEWYQNILMERLQHRGHHWKVVTLTMPISSADTQKDLAALQRFSQELFKAIEQQKH
jgi:exosortase/archaeosortase family protein